MNRLRQWCQSADSDRVELRRGHAWQAPLRQREQLLRCHVVNLAHWAAQQGHSRLHIADLLRMTPRTLRYWRQRDQLVYAPLGRPVIHSPREDRNDVIAVIDALGPRIGVPTLRICFPHMLPAELTDLLKRYRRMCRRRYHQCLQVLHWLVPGTVWAMDFAEAPHPIDGIYSYLLGVRDLASGQQLLWLPLRTATRFETIPALTPLFLIHGAPLVLKTDNGSPFIADDTLAYLDDWGIEQLFSPPGTPRYNGAIEAGIGSLKIRTEQEATRHGRPTRWTCDDVEAARLQANAEARPQGDSGPSPDEAWTQRRSISTAERILFRAAVEKHRQEVHEQGGWPMGQRLDVQEARALDRRAISRALVEHDLLLYRRRRIPLPFPKRKTANIR